MEDGSDGDSRSSWEDDISIIDLPTDCGPGGVAEVTDTRPGDVAPSPQFQVTTQASVEVLQASHYALNQAYRELQRRHSDLTQKHRGLVSQVKRRGAAESPLSNASGALSYGSGSDLAMSRRAQDGGGGVPSREATGVAGRIGRTSEHIGRSQSVRSFRTVSEDGFRDAAQAEAGIGAASGTRPAVSDCSLALQEEFITFLQQQLETERLGKRELTCQLEEQRRLADTLQASHTELSQRALRAEETAQSQRVVEDKAAALAKKNDSLTAAINALQTRATQQDDALRKKNLELDELTSRMRNLSKEYEAKAAEVESLGRQLEAARLSEKSRESRDDQMSQEMLALRQEVEQLRAGKVQMEASIRCHEAAYNELLTAMERSKAREALEARHREQGRQAEADIDSDADMEDLAQCLDKMVALQQRIRVMSDVIESQRRLIQDVPRSLSYDTTKSLTVASLRPVAPLNLGASDLDLSQPALNANAHNTSGARISFFSRADEVESIPMADSEPKTLLPSAWLSMNMALMQNLSPKASLDERSAPRDVTREEALRERSAVLGPNDVTREGALRGRSAVLGPNDVTREGELRGRSAVLGPNDVTREGELRGRSAVLGPNDVTREGALRERSAVLGPNDVTREGALRERSAVLGPSDVTPEPWARPATFDPSEAPEDPLLRDTWMGGGKVARRPVSAGALVRPPLTDKWRPQNATWGSIDRPRERDLYGSPPEDPPHPASPYYPPSRPPQPCRPPHPTPHYPPQPTPQYTIQPTPHYPPQPTPHYPPSHPPQPSPQADRNRMDDAARGSPVDRYPRRSPAADPHGNMSASEANPPIGDPRRSHRLSSPSPSPSTTPANASPPTPHRAHQHPQAGTVTAPRGPGPEREREGGPREESARPGRPLPVEQSDVVFPGVPMGIGGTVRGVAESPPLRVCPICAEDFPAEADQDLFEEHVDNCLGSSTVDVLPSSVTPSSSPELAKVCPVCSNVFPLLFAQRDFEVHVNAHFTDNPDSGNFEILQ